MSLVGNFFEGKRPWSNIKDEVLGQYMSPYIAKVNKKGKPLLLIDAYAGPGVFDDGTRGSPMLICQAAEKFAKNNYKAIFVNNKQKYHNKLTSVLTKAGWASSVNTVLGDSRELLKGFPQKIDGYSTFIYLDPFGLRGCDFELIEPFLTKADTEIVLTMCMPIVHRLAARKARGKNSERLQHYHGLLTNVFGGDYWKKIMWEPGLTTEQRENMLMDEYCAKLKNHLAYVGRCPVRELSDRRIKYFIVFASPHPDSMVLMNDFMIKAYFSNIHKADYAGTLFEQSDWRELYQFREKDLQTVILDTVKKNPGLTRKQIWSKIVQNNFMCFLGSDYCNAVQNLIEKNILVTPTPHSRKRLNDDCVLAIPSP